MNTSTQTRDENEQTITFSNPKDDSAGNIKVNWTTCIGCTMCATVCPQQNYEMKETENGTKSHIRDPYFCTMCMTCVSVCPTQSITITKK